MVRTVWTVRSAQLAAALLLAVGCLLVGCGPAVETPLTPKEFSPAFTTVEQDGQRSFLVSSNKPTNTLQFMLYMRHPELRGIQMERTSRKFNCNWRLAGVKFDLEYLGPNSIKIQDQEYMLLEGRVFLVDCENGCTVEQLHYPIYYNGPAGDESRVSELVNRINGHARIQNFFRE
ncbi:MAG: hypothetical protein RIC55_33970 [Pirellulaceae bacterium]